MNPLTDLNPSKRNNSQHQTNEELNPMKGHVPFWDDGHEQTALYKDIAEVYLTRAWYYFDGQQSHKGLLGLVIV